MSRFAFIPLYLILYFYDCRFYAFLAIMAAGLTDVLDGYIARTTGKITIVGQMLDPLADKSLIIVVILSLLVSGHIPWAAAWAMFFREACMIAGSAYFHFRGKKTVPANAMGKWNTVLTYLVFLFLFFDFPYAETLLWSVIAFSFLTSVVYIIQFKAMNRL
jgi:cardiolipin synthase